MSLRSSADRASDRRSRAALFRGGFTMRTSAIPRAAAMFLTLVSLPTLGQEPADAVRLQDATQIWRRRVHEAVAQQDWQRAEVELRKLRFAGSFDQRLEPF